MSYQNVKYFIKAIETGSFSKADLSKIKSFDYPGKSITFHTALICRNNPEKESLDTIIQEIVEDFELKEIL